MINIRVEAHEVLATFQRLIGVNYQAFLSDASALGARFVRKRFDTGTSPAGGRWQANRGRYAAWKRGFDEPYGRSGRDYGDKPLVLKGELRKAIYGYVDGFAGYVGVKDTYHSEMPDFPWSSTRKSLNAIGAMHEYGTKDVPARPFMGLGTSEVEYITGMLNKRFDQAIK